MSQAISAPLVPPGDSVLLEDVDWRTYTRLLRVFGDRPTVRLTYDRGRLEIMAPMLLHSRGDDFLGQLVRVLTEELDLPIMGGGNVTIRRRAKQRGLEPNRCFWIANAPRMVGIDRLDLRRDPPPDLALELDVTSSSLNRMRIYAKLGVPEVWRIKGDSLTFHVLGKKGTYVNARRSRSFPLVRPSDLLPFFLEGRKGGDQNPILRRFRDWVRQMRK